MIRAAAPCCSGCGGPVPCPAAYCKSLTDPFDYLVGLRDGTIVRAVSLQRVAPGWVRLLGRPDEFGERPLEDGFRGRRCPRGVDVREDFIAWVADSPDGS